MSEATAHNPEDYKVGKGNILGGVENGPDGSTVEEDYRMIILKSTWFKLVKLFKME